MTTSTKMYSVPNFVGKFIYDIEDPNNAIIVERTYDPLIKDFWIRGFNDEIGNTLEPVLPDALQRIHWFPTESVHNHIRPLCRVMLRPLRQ